MPAAFDDLTILEHQDHVRIADGGETVRNNERSTPLE